MVEPTMDAELTATSGQLENGEMQLFLQLLVEKVYFSL